MSRILIGVSAKARSGKGVFAEIAKQEYGASIVPFAGALKEEVAEFLIKYQAVWEPRNLYGGDSDKEETFEMTKEFVYSLPFLASLIEKYANVNPFTNTYKVTFRSLLQWWGTEYRRNQDPNYWVKKAIEKTKQDGIYIFDDLRFENEANAIIKEGGYLVRVDRPHRPAVSNPNHPSETALDYWHNWVSIIINNSTLDEYAECVRRTIDYIIAGGAKCPT